MSQFWELVVKAEKFNSTCFQSVSLDGEESDSVG